MELQPTTTTTIEDLESSIQNLVYNWQRRQRFHHFLLAFSCFPKLRVDIAEKVSWRINLAGLLDSLPVHLATMILILLDLTLTVLDISSTLLSCNDSSSNVEQNKLYHWAGVAILSLLTTKVLALALALGRSFFISPGHLIDGVVMIGAQVLEAVAEEKGAGLLVVVSLWRVVRVVESAFELSNEAIETQVEGIVLEFDVLRAENQRLQEVVAEKERIDEMEEELARMKTFA